MDDKIDCPAPQGVIDALDATLRDLASGKVLDAREAQAAARRLLADFERNQSNQP